MLRKFVSSCLVLFCLAGCAGGTAADTATAAELSAQIVKDLDLGDHVKEVKERTLNGLLFFDEGDVTDASLYVSDRLADTVAVFMTDDPDKVMEKTDVYLKTLKAQLETYAPSEVFKVDNGIVLSGEHIVVVIICDDLQTAKEEAEMIIKGR